MSPKRIHYSISSIFKKTLCNFIILSIVLSNLVNTLTLMTLRESCPFVPQLIPFNNKNLTESQRNASSDGFPNEVAINHLLRVFQMENNHLERRTRHNFAPQYMLDLYDMMANKQNDNKSKLKYSSKIVRSIANRDTSRHFHFYFNVSQLIPSNEQVIEAEFHIYKLKPQLRAIEHIKDPRHHLLEVRVYQILSEAKHPSDAKKRLLDVRRMSTHSFGWDVFYVRQAVLDWIQNENSNYGLLITVTSMLKENVKNGIRFAKRNHHHINRQPIIVIFSTDTKAKISSNTTLKSNNSNYDYGFSELSHQNGTNEKVGAKVVHSPHKEWFGSSDSLSLSNPISSSSSSLNPMNECSRHELYVDFERIGWSAWIISPKGYNAYYCKGECYPLSQINFAKNHKTVRTPYDSFNKNINAVKRCCVPNKLNPLNVLFFDQRGNVVLKRFEDMIIESCECLSQVI